MDRLSNIIAFVTVAETGSFAETARRLNLANSVVSKRVKDLEEYLGVRLLQRSTRRVQLTDAGYGYFDQTRRIIGELAEAEEHLRFQNENPVGELKVSAPVSFGTQFLGPAVASYLEKHRDVTVKLHLSDLMVDFNHGGVDLAVGVGDMPAGSVITKKLAESRRVTVASPAYLKQHGHPQKPQDLSAHNCLSYTHLNDGRHWPYRMEGRKRLQPVGGRFSVNNGMLLCEAAAKGCGIAYLPSFIAGPHVVSGELEVLLEEYEDEPLQIYCAWVQQRFLSARMRSFIDHLAGYFRGFSA